MAAAPDFAAAAPALPDDAVEVGRILDAWGVKGWIRVQPYAKDPQALFSSKRWFLAAREGSLPDAALPALLRVIEAREHGDDVVARIQDVEDRSAAERLRGARIFVARSSFPSTAVDEYYWVDLIGLQVFNRDGLCLGEVSGLLDTGAHSVLQVRGSADAAPTLIPFVAAYIDEVDLAAKRIRVDWGLDF